MEIFAGGYGVPVCYFWHEASTQLSICSQCSISFGLSVDMV